MIEEGIYSGTVWHRRLLPKAHQFNYKMLMAVIDLENIRTHCSPNTMLRHNRFAMLSVRDRDHFSENGDSLYVNVQKLLPDNIKQQDHRIFLVSQLAHFGFAFNPISFFVITSNDYKNILGMILEVHNTPWGERHFYPMFNLQQSNDTFTAEFKKELHVSPFMPMDFLYQFSAQFNDKKMTMTLENWKNNTKHFEAGISLSHHPMTKKAVRQQFIKHPLSPYKAVAAIYWQALKLYVKRIPFYSHPETEKK